MRFDTFLLEVLRRIILVAALPSLMLVACDQSPAEKAQELLRTAQEHYDRSEYSSAQVELKNALQSDPQNAAGRKLLGAVHIKLGDFAGAEKELVRAWDLGLQTSEVKLLLAQARLGKGDYASVVSGTSAEMDLSSPVLRDLLVARGDALLGLGKLHEAEQHYRIVNEVEPHAIAYGGLARVAFSKREYDKAISLLARAIELDPKESQFHAMAGSLYLALRQYDDAEAALQRALALDSNSATALVNLARLRIQENDFAVAGQLVDRLMEQSPQRLSVMTLKGYVSLALKDFKAADQWSKRVLAYDSENVTALYVSGTAAFALNEMERARSHLTQYLRAEPDDTLARAVLGKAGESHSVEVRESKGEPQSSPLLTKVSLRALEAGEAQSSRRALEFLAERSPDNPSVHARLSMAKSTAGDLRQAREQYAQALELDSDAQHQDDLDRAATALILSYMRSRDYGAAIESAQRFQERRPDLATPYSLMAMVYLEQDQTGRARGVLEDGLRKFPNSIELLGNLSALEARSGNIQQAIALSERLIGANGEHYPTLLRLATLSLLSEDRVAARSWALRAMEVNPSAPGARVLLARLHLASNNFEEALKIISDIEASSKSNPQVLEVMGEAHLGLDQVDAAIADFELLTKVEPASAPAYYRLARAYGIGGRPDRMEAAFKDALEIDPDHYRTLVAYSRHLMQQRQLDDAEEMVKRLERNSDDNPEVTKLSAELAMLQSDYPRAIEKFTAAQTAFAKGGVFDQSITTNLSNAYWEIGEEGKAVEVLQEWLANEPNDALMRLKLASRWQALGEETKAAEEFARVIALSPENWVARNQFALLLHSQGSLDAARSQAETAVEQSGRNPLVMDTLGVIRLSGGDTAGAASVLLEAHERAPKHPEIGLHLSQALIAAGRGQEAREMLDKFLSQPGTFAQRSEMESLRRTLD